MNVPGTTMAIRVTPRHVAEKANAWKAFLAFVNRPKFGVYEDEFVTVDIPFGWGMRQLSSNIRADLPSGEFMQVPREEHQRHMDEYFKMEIEIFPPRGEGEKSKASYVLEAPWLREALHYVVGFMVLGSVAIAALLALWAIQRGAPQLLILLSAVYVAGAVAFLFAWRLAMHFVNGGLWPGLLEERLQMITESMFPNADADVRRVIDKFADTFLDNNWMYVRLKRLFQAIAIICFNIAAAPALFAYSALSVYFPEPILTVSLGIWGGFWCLLGLILFNWLNGTVFENKYIQTLQNTTNNVSNVIMKRMQALNELHKDYCNKIQQIQEHGEWIADRDINLIKDLKDSELKDGGSFFATQMLIWLAKRLEYIELHLLHSMHTAQTIHALLTVASYVGYLVIAALGLMPLMVFAIFQFAGIVQFTGSPSFAMWVQIVAGLAAATLIILVSHQSYYRSKWNSGKSILQERLNVSKGGAGWDTFAKLEFDVKLAARSQRAMARIKLLWDRIGFNAGHN